MITPITTLQYLDKDHIQSAQRMQAEYYRDVIRKYGVTTVYYKNNIKWPSVSSQTNVDYELYDAKPFVYNLSANLDVYVEVSNDMIVLNVFGAVPDTTGRISFMIDEFNFAFDSLGQNYVLPETEQITATVSGGNVILSSNFVSDEELLSGLLSAQLTLSTSGVTSGVTPMTFSLYSDSIPVNYMIAQPNYYDYTRTLSTAISATYTANLNSSLSGPITANISGNFTYTRLKKFDDFRKIITPAVGDYIVLPVFEDNKIELEITQVLPVSLAADGINPLLAKYIWRCDVARRSSSHESTGTREVLNDAPLSAVSNAVSNEVSDDLFNYTSATIDTIDTSKSDRMFGGY